MPESVDQQISIAAVYADALFELARRQSQEGDVGEELAALQRLLESDQKLATFMASRSLGTEQREASLERMFRGRLSDLTLNTLLVMNQNDRAGLVALLHRAYALRQRETRNEVDVTVTSAIELDGAQRGHVERTAAELAGKTPVVKYEVRPEILGGLILQIGDLRYDYSVRQQLRTAAARLVERGERGLRIGIEQES